MDRRQFIKKAGLGASTVIAGGAAAGLVGACRGQENCSRRGSSRDDSAQIGRPAVMPRERMQLSFEPYQLELRHTFTVASYSRKSTPGMQVRIRYGGLTGYGEASMPPYLGQSVESVGRFLQRVDLAQFADPFRMEEILDYVDSISPEDSAAKAAVDIALHDLVGKLLGAPWFRIWGLNPEKCPDTTFTIGIDTPDVVREKTRECAEKFNILKVKVGLDNDEEMIRTIREVTDKPIAVDANQGWKDRYKATLFYSLVFFASTTPIPGLSGRCIFPSITSTPLNRSLLISRLPSRSARSTAGESCAAAETAQEVSVIQPSIVCIPMALA